MFKYAIFRAHTRNYLGDARSIISHRGHWIFDDQGACSQSFLVSSASHGHAGSFDFQRGDRHYVASGVFLGIQETIEKRIEPCC